MPFKPIDISRKKVNWARIGLLFAIVTIIASGTLFWVFNGLAVSRSARWQDYQAWQQGLRSLSDYRFSPGARCENAPFVFPTSGVIFGLWGQVYRPGQSHTGLDIFAGTELNVSPVYATYDGYLTRLSDWRSAVIIRIPEDPLHAGRQIWVYYTHMADEQGNSFIDAGFPPGTSEVFVEAGTLLGFQGNYSGDPANPTGLHLHISIVKDDGKGNFMNETNIDNTYDPSPYFNLRVNNESNPDDFPICVGESIVEDWALVPENE